MLCYLFKELPKKFGASLASCSVLKKSAVPRYQNALGAMVKWLQQSLSDHEDLGWVQLSPNAFFSLLVKGGATLIWPRHVEMML